MHSSLASLLLQSVSLLAALVHLGLGTFVLVEDPRNRASRLFAFLCLTFFAWSACWGLFVVAPDLQAAAYWNRVSTLGWALAPALLLNFFVVYTRRADAGHLPGWAFVLLYAPGLVFCGAAVGGPVVAADFVRTPLGWAEVLDQGAPLYWTYIVYYAGYCVASLMLCWRWGRRSNNMRERRRAWLMFTAGVCSLTLATTLAYAQPLVAATSHPGLSHLATLLWSGGMVLAIHRYRLLTLSPESAAQDVLGGMGEAVLLLDPEHRVLYANRAAERLLDLEPAGLVGRRIEDVGGEDLASAVDDVVDGSVSSPGLPSERALRFASGVERLVNMRALPMSDNFAQLYGVALVIADITEQRKLRQRLELADVTAQRERLASVGMLATSVAHQVNNPLGYVMANLEIVLDALRGANAQGHAWVGDTTVDELMSSLDEALDGTERVRRIVQDLRGFASSERAGSTRPVQLEAIIEGALTLAGNEIKHRARVVRELQPLPPILGNESELSQVFLNLLMNAAHAIPAGNATQNRITVRSWNEDEAVCLEIEDSGRGIALEDLPFIFEPFHSSRPDGEGAGLGLPIARRIVEAMGGSIHAYSEQGVGSRFAVRLPRTLLAQDGGASARPAPSAEPRFGEDIELRPEPLPNPDRRVVLLVDDEALLLAAMARLASIEHNVETAGSGDEAIALLEGGARVDLVVSDLMMAEGSGMELFDWLQEHRPELAASALFLTGGTFSDDAAAFVDRFPQRVLRKPVSRGTLLGALARAFGETG